MENVKTTEKPRKKKRGVGEDREGFTPLTVIMLVVLLIYVASMIFLIIWTGITSVKHYRDFNTGNVIGLPRPTNPTGKVVWGWQFANYITVFQYFYVETSVMVDGIKQTVNVYMPSMFLNGLLYAAGCAFFKALVPMLTAYTCARFNYFFSKIMHAIVIVTMILPIVGSLPAEIKMAKFFGLYDQLWGLWIMRGNFLGMYFLIFYGSFKALPMAYTEAAKIDGAGNFAILWHIILPLVKNTFFTIFLLHFIAFWNDYNTPLIYMPSYPTIAYGLYYLTNVKSYGDMSYVPMQTAAAVTMIIPTLALFLASHKRLLGNLTVGGIKG